MMFWKIILDICIFSIAHIIIRSSSIYFPLTSIHIYMYVKMTKENWREEGRSGTTGKGVSQKDLQVKKMLLVSKNAKQKKRALCN